jgi:hypothetical protein
MTRRWQRVTFPLWFPPLVLSIACVAAWAFGRAAWEEVWS